MSTQPNALRLAGLVDHGSDSTLIERQIAAELRAQQELIQTLKSILGGVLKCERNSDGQIVLNGWQESVISIQLAAAEAHK